MRRIIQFDVVMENGTKYVFGGNPGRIEQREIETLRIGTHFLYTKVFDCPVSTVDNKYYYDCGGEWSAKFSSVVDFNVTTMPAFISKWHLGYIIEPSGETTTFQYEKLDDVTYTTRPSTILIRPVCNTIFHYSKKIEECPSMEIFGWCPYGTRTYYYNFQDIMVVSKFPGTAPGSAPEPTISYFNPMRYGWSPGAVNEYRMRIVESNIKLVQITSATKNRVSFSTSSRSDLPNSFRYDLISLFNMHGQLIKSVKLNFDLLEANKDNDRCWISEALMIRNLKSFKTDATFFFADYLLKHTASDIDNENYRKFVFEGVKEYNYYRTFLNSVVDITAASRPVPLFRFDYQDTNMLRRRTTTYADVAGFHRSKVYEESYDFAKGRINTAQSFSPQRDNFINRIPLAGLLTKIHYPTNGSTEFTYGVRRGARLDRIRDLNEKGEVMSQRELEYTRPYSIWSPVTSSYQDFKIEGTSSWMKYHISSSAPQNDPNFTHGVMEGNGEVIVYHGTKTENNGFERYNFTYPPDYPDSFSDMKSHPIEKDTNDIPYQLRNLFPFPKANSRDHLRGLLTRHQIFASGSPLDKPIRETFHDYALNPYGYDPEHIIGFRGGSFMWTTSSSTHFFYGNETAAQRRYRWGWTHYYTDWMVLKKTRDVIYDDDNPLKQMVQVTEFEYDSVHQQQVERITYNEGNPTEKSIVRYKYITDKEFVVPATCHTSFKNCREKCVGTDECYRACDQLLQNCLSPSTNPDIHALVLMRRKFQYAVPIETQNWNEKSGIRKLVSATVHKFQLHKPNTLSSSWSVKPKEIWAVQKLVGAAYQEAKLNDITPVGLALDSRMRRVHTFNSYDLVSGNIMRQTLLDGTVAEFGWEPLSNFSTIKSQTVNPGTEQHQTTYQQIPLVGLSAVTDPNNRLTSYLFDLNKRLKVVYDHNNNVLTSYRYHYASEAGHDSMDASFKATGMQTVGSNITFSAVRESREYGNTRYVWDFGDGSPKKETSSNGIIYRYPVGGIFTVVLTKSNPEYGSVSSSMQLKIIGPLIVTVCIDGPSHVDIPPGSMNPVPGSCTTLPMISTLTRLKATTTGGCDGITYQWEKIGSMGTFEPFTTVTSSTTVAPVDFMRRILNTYRVRCVATDSCGNTSTSNTVDLVIF
jgi:hypothetical protein